VTPVDADAAGRAGLLAKLMAAVRPEFRVDVLVSRADHPILGGGACRVPGCDRALRSQGMCTGHHLRWRSQGKPDLERFCDTTSPGLVGTAKLLPCVAPGCGFGRYSHGLCDRHDRAWRRAGCPDRATWLAALVRVDPSDRRVCRVPSCDLWAQGNLPFCRPHTRRWQTAGRPDPELFVEACEDYGLPRFDFGALRPQVRLELQYALQCRVDEGRIKTRPELVMRVARAVAASGVRSLLDWPVPVWRRQFAERVQRSGGGSAAFLAFALDRLEELQHGRGWEVEFPRDVWRLRNLGRDGGHLRFDRIPQPWLQALAKRWLRLRLSNGLSDTQAARDVAAVTAFAEFLATSTVQVGRLADVDRDVLERYLAHLGTDRPASTTIGMIGSLNSLLQAIRQHRWDDTLPTTAVLFSDDYPKRPKRLPRWLADHVMAQVEQPTNLDRWPNAAGRLVTLILIRCGLRVGDACTLAFDCVVHDAQGAPYLRYVNHKMKREALVPIDEDLEREIAAQQGRVLARWPAGTSVLFPQAKANPDGSRPLNPSTYRQQLNRWLATCDVRDKPGPAGKPVHLTPHQWRHTFATRLSNRDVPQEVVRVLLDHESHEMTSHYARLHDQTVRKQWERARKVNCQGEEVTIEPESPLADAQWVKHRVGLAKQALPNGYCGLPLVQTCPHANACLTCPVFVTTPEFLDEHRAHRGQTRRLLETAQARGQLRMVEMNQQVLRNLDRIIAKLEAGEDPQAHLEGATDAG
jgi:integrase